MLSVLLIIVSLSGVNAQQAIDAIEKKAKGKTEWLLLPDKPYYGNYYQGVDIFHRPDGNRIVEAPKSLKVVKLREKKGWSEIAVLNPYILTGWVKSGCLSKIITRNTFFYHKPSLKAQAGYFSQGVIVREIKKQGKFSLVELNHYVPLRVWVESIDVGLKFERYRYVKYKYYSKWKRNIYEVKKGAIYEGTDKKVITAFLTDDSKFKVERTQGKMTQIASPSDYDIKFRGWVESSRVGKKPHYYYSYQYSFRSPSPVSPSWFGGQFKLNRPKTLYSDSNGGTVQMYIRKGTPVLFFKKTDGILFEIVFGRGYYNSRSSTLTYLLDSFDQSSSQTHYISNYDKTWKIRKYTKLSMEDFSPSN
ncbi:MAG: hypothetical protein JXR95_15270 [Deltaproteobacteria bacterium]|nr:hypothetical protein [Deltaproteobacteria bacterium]